MKNFTSLLIILFIVNLSFSQTGWQPGMISSLDRFENVNERKAPLKYTGTPYIEEDFVPGTISDEAGNTREAYLRYNSIEEIVEIQIKDNGLQGIRVLPRVKELTYTLNDYKYIFGSFITSEGEKLEGYFIEYFEGDSYGLYGNPIPKLMDAEYSKRTLGHGRLPHLSVEVEYFIKTEDGIFTRVNLKNKDFKKILPQSAPGGK
ncbi:hypothetical protein FK178_02925 [Antarcticibacterium arcticum]|uniref:Uncharacterized protein n=1 Tax=Antarcticibacterium arcticum TaxID=2585771 RepID=A0A5B8YLW2_9FLAO|nr:hypothetical protein [Antarcticibacterium arcticum]QED36729.1 hypothetical protein FK178_02925 [Antarcticibacterium arcticum]